MKIEEMSRYNRRGVSSSKEDVHSAISHLDKGLFPGAFCKIIPDYLTNNDDYALVLHADGAGTKSSLAFAYWKESSDLDIWRGISQDSIVMNIDDLLCIGAVDNFLLSSTIGRNKNLIPAEVITELIKGNQSFCDKLKDYDINIVLTGGETADIGDLVRTVIVDSTVAARIRRDEIIDASKIESGNVIVGLSSFGQSIYENEYNSGIGSNGLTSARHELLNKEVMLKYPESYDHSIPDELVYSGSKSLLEVDPQTGFSYGKLLLSPTRTYAPVIKDVLNLYRDQIKGIIHCSGGGQTKVLNFIRKLRVVKNNLFTPPPIFTHIQSESDISWREMYQVFNMGHRMEIYTNSSVADDIIKISNRYNIEAKIIGYVEEYLYPEVIIDSDFGKFVYSKK